MIGDLDSISLVKSMRPQCGRIFIVDIHSINMRLRQSRTNKPVNLITLSWQDVRRPKTHVTYHQLRVFPFFKW